MMMMMMMVVMMPFRMALASRLTGATPVRRSTDLLP